MDWKELTGRTKLAQMKDAIEVLIRWQHSVYYMPLLENPSAYSEEKERIAAVLVDNHLGKLAQKVRMLPDLPGEYQDVFLNQWTDITFMAHLWLQFDHLSDELKLNLLYRSGPNITKRHLDAVLPYRGVFHVVAIILIPEENLQRRTVCFLEPLKNQIYVLIEYSFRNRPFDRVYEVGDTYEGEVIIYPVEEDRRIRIKSLNKVAPPAVDALSRSGISIQQLAKNLSGLLKVNPFSSPVPVILSLHSTFEKEQGWMVADTSGHVIRISKQTEEDRLRVLYSALFYGPLPVAGLWDSTGFLPESYYNGEVFLPF